MSVTIADIMKLPSLSGAKVVAGHEGMNQTVTSITVLESDEREIIGVEILGNMRSFGSEIVITAFIAARDNVEMQCETLRRLQQEGEIAMILYYVGEVLPCVSQQLMDTANEINMPIIVMPERRLDLRYSDVICDVMEAIIRDQDRNAHFATQVIEKLSHIESSQQSIGMVLAMIRDHTHCSVFLTDEADMLLNYSEWPNKHNLPYGEILQQLRQMGTEASLQTVEINGNPCQAIYSTINSSESNLNLIVVKENGILSQPEFTQIYYILKTYLNLWTENYGKLDTKQLVSAIFHDEPEKMYRIADMLKVNIADLSYTYLLYSKKEDHNYENLKKVRSLVKEFTTAYKNHFITDIFDETVVVIADRRMEKLDKDLPELFSYLKQEGFDYRGIIIDAAETTHDAKTAYWMYQTYRDYIPVIFRGKNVITGGELNFIKKIKDIFDNSDYEAFIERVLQPEKFSEKGESLLTDTIETYLLDADMNMVKTAELMFVHNNTIKYRMRTIEKILGHKFNRMPEVYDLYTASALNRLKKSIFKE